jgi:hypothetical protein
MPHAGCLKLLRAVGVTQGLAGGSTLEDAASTGMWRDKQGALRQVS